MAKDLLCIVLQIYFLCLIGRALLSWFPIDQSSSIYPIARFLYSITEPVLAPVRSVVPRGVIDISFLIVIIGVQVIISALGCRVSIL